jgi:CBS domain-containing protein
MSAPSDQPQLLARHVMRQPLHTIQAADSVALAVRQMQINRISSLIVPPRYEGEVYGILTKHDILGKVVAAGRDPLRVLVREAMSTPLIGVDPESPLRRCASLMMLHRIRRLPVLVAGRPVAMVSDSDVFDALLNVHTEAAWSASL